MPHKEKITVAVAMSGGIDSSVAAALLQQQGYKVLGFFMHFWADPEFSANQENRCCSLASQQDAAAVARHLKIPFYVLNCEKTFKKEVVDYYLKATAQGLTPNPCVTCNKKIKFSWLVKKINALGVDYLATGHYLKLKKHKQQYYLFQAKDQQKDQSYFLYNLTQPLLKKLMFPLGDLYKATETRALAKKFKLPFPEKSESQDLCFINRDKQGFLRKYLPRIIPGEIKEFETKQHLGTHQGLVFYTLGQRAAIGGKGPYYVKKIDQQQNLIWVTSNKKLLETKEFKLKNVNWINPPVKFPFTCKVRVRYHHPLVNCQVNKHNILLDKPLLAVTPGQAAVFYKRGQLLGGGVIATFPQ